jgi:hypothetical protein
MSKRAAVERAFGCGCGSRFFSEASLQEHKHNPRAWSTQCGLPHKNPTLTSFFSPAAAFTPKTTRREPEDTKRARFEAPTSIVLGEGGSVASVNPPLQSACAKIKKLGAPHTMEVEHPKPGIILKAPPTGSTQGEIKQTSKAPVQSAVQKMAEKENLIDEIMPMMAAHFAPLLTPRELLTRENLRTFTAVQLANLIQVFANPLP